MNPVLSFLNQLFHPQSNFSYTFRQPSNQLQQQPAQPTMPAQTPQPTMAPLPNNLADTVRTGVSSRYGADNPILANLDSYLQAGQQLPQGMDQLLPLILASSS